MMSADDEILQRQPKGFNSNSSMLISPESVSKKKNISFSLRRVTPDKNDPMSTPTMSSNKKLFGGLRGNNSGSGRGKLGVRSIEKQQKMQDEYYEGYADDGNNTYNHADEQLDDGDLPSLSPLAKGGRLVPLSPPRSNQPNVMSPPKTVRMAEDYPTANVTSSSAMNRNVTPTSETDYETLKVAGFWSQLDAADDDSSESDYGKSNASSHRAQEEEMPNDERRWRRSQSPARNPNAQATNAMGLSLVQNTSTESTIKTEVINKTNNNLDDSESETSGNGGDNNAGANGGWNLLEMSRFFAADNRQSEQEGDEASESQGLDRNYNPNARMVSPSNGNVERAVYEDEDEGIIENICVQLGNICGFGDSAGASNNKRHGQYDDGDSVFENLDGQEDVAIELGYVEPEEEKGDVVAPKKKKKGWKSFLGIKKKSPPRKTLVTETTMSGREPIDGDTTKVSDLNVAQTYSGNGLNPLDDHPTSVVGAAAAAVAAAGTAAIFGNGSYIDDDDEELESQAAGWDAKRKNMYLRQLASQAKTQQRAASNSFDDDDDDDVYDEEEDTTINRPETPETYTADYTNFNPSDKSKFLRFLNAGMSPQDATRAVIEERDAVVEEEEGYRDDESEEVPRDRARHFPNNDEIVSVQSEDPPGVRKGQSGESAELSTRDGDLDGLIDELENHPASQSEIAGDSKATPLEAYQDRAVIPMVPAIVSAKKKSKSRQKQEEEEGVNVENQDGLAPSGIQYYDAVSEDKNDEDIDYDDNNSRQKRSQHIGRPRLGTSIASSFAAKVASKRFESTGKNKSKYGKVSERPSASEEASDSPSVPRVVSMPSPEEEDPMDKKESSSGGGDEASLSKPKTNVFDLMQRKKNKNFSKLESDGFTALPSMSAKSDEDDLPSWARNAPRDAETVTSAFSPPIENMDVEQVDDQGIVPEVQQEDDVASTPDDEITEAEYDEDTVSLMGQTFMTGASGYSRRRRRKGAARSRVANAKELESQVGVKSKGWMDSIQEAASKNGQVWHPEKGWVNYSEPEEELQGSENYGSAGTLQGPQSDPSKSIPIEAQAQVVGFTTPRSVTVTEFDDQSVVTKLTVNTAAESPTILTTSTAPTRRAGRKPRPTDQRKIAAAHANKPIGWKDSMQNAASGVDNGGFRWDFEKGWIRIDGSSIDDDEASALTESVFYNEGQDLDQPPKSELLPVTEEDADEFSDDDEDVFNDIDQKNEVDTVGSPEELNSYDSSEKENSHANKISETESHGRDDDISKEKLDPVQSSNTLLDRIMAAEPKEPVFISATEDEDIEEVIAKDIPAQERGITLLDRILAAEPEKPVFGEILEENDEQSADEISREPSGIGTSQFAGDEVDVPSEVEPSRDPSGDRASQFNSVQEDPSGKTGDKSSSSLTEASIQAPLPPKKSLNTWLESSNATTPDPHKDNTSSLREESVIAVKTVEPQTKIDSFTLESFEDEEVFGSTQVVKEKFSDTESELFQPFESEIKKTTFESFESQGSTESDWVSTTLKRQSPVTTSDEVSQKARVWMDSMKNDGKTEELSSESGSNEPRVNKADPPQSFDPPTSHLERIKKRPANSWIKSKGKDDGEPPQKEEKPLPPVESNVGSLRSKFESKKIDGAVEGNDENVVVFKSQAMGIRLKRGEDGFVRVVSVTQAAFGSSIDRVGPIEPGDTIKEAAGIDLRSPITNSQWGEAVTQIRSAPRPMTFIVAAGAERKSSTPMNPAKISAAIPPQSHNVVKSDINRTSNETQALQSVKEYRRHHSPERAGISTPNRRQYGTPDHKQYKHSSYHDSPDRSVYTEASSVFSEDLPTKDSFFNRIAACATAGAAACAPGGAKQRTADDTEKSQVPMAHLKFLRTNPTITRVTNAAKNRLVCGRPDTIFEETGGDPAYDLGRTKSNTSLASGGLPRGPKIVNDSSEFDRSRATNQRTTVGDNTAFLENLDMDSPVTSKLNESKKDNEIPARPKLMVQSYINEGGEVGWPEENEAITWEKDTIENVSTVSAHSKKKETAIKAEILAAAKVEAMMDDLDQDEDSECEI